MVDILNPQILAVFIIFVLVLLAFYKLIKSLIKAVLVILIAFSFPWIAAYLNLGLAVPTTIDTGLQFATIGLILFLIYEFFHFVVAFFKLLLWPFKVIFKRK